MAEYEIDNEAYDDDVGLGAEDKKYARSNNLEWFKGEKGRTYRVAFVYFHPLEAQVVKAMRKQNPQVSKEDLVAGIKKVLAKKAEQLSKPVDQLTEIDRLDTNNVQFKKVEGHYKEGIGFVLSRLGKDGPDADQVWKMMGDPKTYFTTVLLVYPTNKEGELIKEQIAHFTVVPWRFGSKVYATLHQRAAGLRENGLSIASQDMLLKCTNTDFQAFDIDAAGPAIWSKSPKLAEAVLNKAHPLYEKLVPFRELSTADLKIKLGVSGATGEEAAVTDDDFNSLLDQVG